MSLQFCGTMIADIKSEREARSFAPQWASGVQHDQNRLANGSPFGGNGDDRRQWRKQGGAVGAAASRMRGPHQGPKQTLGAATRVRSTTGEPGRPTLDAESFLISETVVPCYRGKVSL